MTISASVPVEWKAPSEDGQVLIWPEPQVLLEQTRQNHRQLAAQQALIQNRPLCELRREQRRWVGHGEEGRLLIASGHQIELYHPGVWAKDVLGNELALRLGGDAYHFAVDTDAPKHLYLRWPGDAEPITDDPNLTTADWAGLLEAPTPGHLEDLRRRFEDAASKWDFRPLLHEFFPIMRRLLIESRSLTLDLTNAIHQLDWHLGLRHHALTVSPMWQSPPYLALVYHILARADEFIAIYNGTLGEYRREMGIRHSGRPWPDLRREEDCREVPFWLDDLSAQQRSRACIKRIADRFAMQSPGGEVFSFDPGADADMAARQLGEFLARNSVRLAPRAATLTMFFRLLLCDQFIHGIGGARYDQVTDRIIHRFFGIEPPAFSVTTATLLFPAAVGQERIDLRALRVEGRRLRHAWADAAKRNLAREIDSLPRHSPERRQLFYRMHEDLAGRMRSEQYHDWQRRFEHARETASDQQEIFDRELFYPLQCVQRLGSLIERYHAYMG